MDDKYKGWKIKCLYDDGAMLLESPIGKVQRIKVVGNVEMQSEIKRLEAGIKRLTKKLNLAIAQDYCSMCGKTLDGYEPSEEATKQSDSGDNPICICTMNCLNPCTGKCGCEACHESYNDFLSSQESS